MLRVGMPSSTLRVVWPCDRRGTQSVQDGILMETVGTSDWQSRAVHAPAERAEKGDRHPARNDLSEIPRVVQGREPVPIFRSVCNPSVNRSIASRRNEANSARRCETNPRQSVTSRRNEPTARYDGSTKRSQFRASLRNEPTAICNASAAPSNEPNAADETKPIPRVVAKRTHGNL
jgi:hypothetical protein